MGSGIILLIPIISGFRPGDEPHRTQVVPQIYELGSSTSFDRQWWLPGLFPSRYAEISPKKE